MGKAGRTGKIGRLGVTAAVLSCVLACPGGSARGDDWSVTRSPMDPRLLSRYRAELLRDPDDAATLDELCDLYARYRSARALEDEYRAALKSAPESFALNEILGHLARRAGDDAKAETLYRAAASARPDDPRPWEHLAETEHALRKDDAACDAYGKAIEQTRPAARRAGLLRSRARIEIGAGRLDAARDDLTAAGKLGAAVLDDRIDLAEAFAHAGRPKDALPHFRDAEGALASDTARRARILVEEADAQEASGDDDGAVLTYRRTMALTAGGHWMRREIIDRIVAIYRKKDDLRSLLAYYERTWPPAARGELEHEVLGKLYEETGDTQQALAQYSAAIDADPSQISLRVRVISLLDRLGRDDEVIEQYHRLIRAAPGEPRYRIELAERTYRKGETGRALRMLDDVGVLFAGDESVHSALADLYARWGAPDKAFAEARRLVAIDPTNEGFIVALGELYFQRGDTAKAVATWRRLLDAIPRKDEAYARLGDVLGEHDRGEEAVDAYQRAAQLAPSNPAYERGLALVYERLRRPRDAERAWQTVIDLCARDAARKPMRREARSRLIALWSHDGIETLANRFHGYQTRFAASPPDVDAGYFVAEILLAENQATAAEQALARIASLEPNDPEPLAALAAVYRSEGRYDDAVRTLRALAKLLPQQAKEIESQIADLEVQLYRDDDAVTAAQAAASLSPSDPAAEVKLARIYERKGDDAQAEAAYRKAFDMNGHLFKVDMDLALLYVREGRRRDASLIYRQIVRGAADEELLADAARRAIDLDEYDGELADLERDFSELPFLHTEKPIYRRILVELYGRWVPRLVARSRSGDAAAAAELHRIGEHGLEPLLAALADSDPEQRKIALGALGYLSNPNAVPALLHLATDRLGEVEALGPGTTRRPAADTAENLGAADPAGAGAATPADMDARVAAVVAIGRLADARAVPALAPLLANREKALAEAAAWSLGRSQSPAAVPSLLRAVEDADARPGVAAFACEALGTLRARAAVKPLIARLGDASLPDDARAACALALGHIGDRTATAALAGAVGARATALGSAAARALGMLGDAAGDGPLLRALAIPDEAMQHAVLGALSATPAIGGEEIATDVSLGTFEPGGAIAPPGEEAAGADGAPGGRVVPWAVLRDRAEDVAGGYEGALRGPAPEAHAALDQLAAGELGPLAPSLAAARAAGRGAAVDALISAVLGKLAPRLRELAGAESPDMRAAAIRLLARQGGGAAAPVLARGLKDTDANVRMAAMAGATLLEPAPVGLVAALATAVHAAASPMEQVAAERALARLAGAHSGAARAQAAAALTSALADHDPFVREAAARGLGEAKLADASALAALRHAAASDDVAAVRTAAAAAIAAQR